MPADRHPAVFRTVHPPHCYLYELLEDTGRLIRVQFGTDVGEQLRQFGRRPSGRHRVTDEIARCIPPRWRRSRATSGSTSPREGPGRSRAVSTLHPNSTNGVRAVIRTGAITDEATPTADRRSSRRIDEARRVLLGFLHGRVDQGHRSAAGGDLGLLGLFRFADFSSALVLRHRVLPSQV